MPVRKLNRWGGGAFRSGPNGWLSCRLLCFIGTMAACYSGTAKMLERPFASRGVLASRHAQGNLKHCRRLPSLSQKRGRAPLRNICPGWRAPRCRNYRILSWHGRQAQLATAARCSRRDRPSPCAEIELHCMFAVAAPALPGVHHSARRRKTGCRGDQHRER